MGVALSDLLHPFLFVLAAAVSAAARLAFLQYIAQQHKDKQRNRYRYGQCDGQAAPFKVCEQENGNGG